MIRNLAAAATIATVMISGAASAQSVTQDGDGWVKVDGKTIARVWVSYGYNVSCKYGNKSGWGSGSFKPDVDSMKEAVGVALAACKR